MSAPKRKKIVFVCTGNTCRSPMAEVLLRNYIEKLGLKGFTVKSAGLKAKRGTTINEKSAQVLKENGLSAEKFSATPLTDKLLCDAFLIISMTDSQRDYIMDKRWNALKKVGQEAEENNTYAFSEIAGYEIPDPYGRDIDCYRYVFDMLVSAMPRLAEKLNLRAHAYIPKTKSKKK